MSKRVKESKGEKRKADVMEDDTPTSPKKAKITHNFSNKYNWEKLHKDLDNDIVSGTYGGAHAAYHGLAAVRVGRDLKAIHKTRSKDEFIQEEIERHLKKPSTRARWNEIFTLDPLGMFAKTPTMAATTAHMDIPEIKDKLVKDGKIVNGEGCINCIKLAIDYVWNLPGMAERFGMDEGVMRKSLQEYTQNDSVTDKKFNAFLPPVGGITVYFIGDVDKMSDKKTEIAVRVHDACCGSDVFGTDICTCRPYLIYAIQQAVECAQRGGVGLIIYFQKEGRSLGEVTKFRVYNARKRQEGGDRPEMYFAQTESIAGIRDARFQEMMPDVLLWLGINRIDWLLSMSADKYDAIHGAGIDVMQRVALPDMYVPKNATVEISAKIASGYHSQTFESKDVLATLRELTTIRERCKQVYELAEQNKTKHFALDTKKLDAVVKYVQDVTKENYPKVSSIPYHSRWRHFDEKAVGVLANSWPVDPLEKTRRLLDMVTVSVLLDAGAGPTWKYIDNEGKTWTRSEGLAHASMDMFKEGIFSSDVAVPHRVNAHGLKALTVKQLSNFFQVSHTNPMVGLDGRCEMMRRLGQALSDHPEFFGKELARPGNVVDYVLAQCDKGKKVSIRVLWKALIEGFENIWPENLAGVRRGDVWVYTSLRKTGQPASDHIPFHKLTQWLTYSMLEPFEQIGVRFTDMHLLTGLAEYRNGGLFVDLGVLTPRDKNAFELSYDVGSEMVVEWRALTLILLDKVAERMREKLKLTEEQLPLAKVLQGGTWAAGRQIAQEKRPSNRAPPISVRSDGTVF